MSQDLDHFCLLRTAITTGRLFLYTFVTLLENGCVGIYHSSFFAKDGTTSAGGL